MMRNSDQTFREDSKLYNMLSHAEKCNYITRLTSDESIGQWFNIDRLIGKGSFANVFLAIRRSDSNLCALKCIDKCQITNDKEIVENEVKIVKNCSHVNICRLLDAFETFSTYIITFEYAYNGDLFDIIKRVGKLNEHTAARITAETANGLSYLHKRNIVHRDLKPENLLLSQDFTIKLADFGLACIASGPLYRICGTLTYIAPEMLAEKGYGIEVDTWSLGIILHIMLAGYAPWQCPDREHLFRLIVTSKITFKNPIWSRISQGAKELLGNILTCKVSKRITCREILCHQWIISKLQKKENKIGRRELEC